MSEPEPSASQPAPSSSDGPASPGAVAPPAPTRAGEPAPPGSSEGRARSFREHETQRRGRRRELFGQLLVVAIIILGIYAIVSARPFVPASGPGPPTPGPPITVKLANPIVGQVTCGNGDIAYTEQVVWLNSTASVTTLEVNVYVYELLDNDIVSDNGVIANVSSTSLCAGDPPHSGGIYSWYAVLMAPNGTLELSYTFDQGWTSVTHSPTDITIANGSSLVVVIDPQIAGRGYGLKVAGTANGSSVLGEVPL